MCALQWDGAVPQVPEAAAHETSSQEDSPGPVETAALSHQARGGGQIGFSHDPWERLLIDEPGTATVIGSTVSEALVPRLSARIAKAAWRRIV